MDNANRIPKNPALLVGLALPVLMVALVAAVVYLPRLFDATPDPQYDFVYSPSPNGLSASAKGLEWPPRGTDEPPAEPLILRYSVVTGQSQPLTLEQAQALQLDPTAVSPDGYELIHGRRRDGFPLAYGRNYGRHFLVNGHRNLEVTLESPRYITFLAWILENE